MWTTARLASAASSLPYRIADLQPWAREEMRKANEQVHAGKVPFRPRERCYPAGVPGFVVYTLAEPYYFLQTAKQVTIVDQGGPEVRRIYLDVPHSPKVTPSWYGESVGHYEGGDTLVVDTDRHLDQIIRRQLSHAAYRQAVRGRAFQAHRERQRDGNSDLDR
jgi:hypothetical protein